MAAFFQNLSRFGKARAVSFPSQSGELQHLSYAELQKACDEFKAQLPSSRCLIAIVCHNDLPTLVAYLACLQAHHPVLLLDQQTSEAQLAVLQKAYSFNRVIRDGVIEEMTDTALALDEKLAVLLSTSGSTGSPKQVALSYDNIEQNCQSICAYLPIESDDTVITTLPFNYAYGLSVIHTHLAKGARVVLSEYSVIDKLFWQLLEQEKVTSLSGVPYTYEMLLRLGLVKKELPFLRYLTQAGGKLSVNRVKALAEYGVASNTPFYVMYGQTEATARMAYIEPCSVINKPDSIGKPIEQGSFYLMDAQGSEIERAGVAGELVYRGPNVMLGYVTCYTELAALSSMSELKTGDVAYFDEDGDFFITGRLKRFVKIFGKRVSLDEVEMQLKTRALEVGVIGSDNKLRIAVTEASLLQSKLDPAKLLKQASTELKIHHSTIQVHSVDSLPKTANGKLDYKALEEKIS